MYFFIGGNWFSPLGKKIRKNWGIKWWSWGNNLKLKHKKFQKEIREREAEKKNFINLKTMKDK